MAGKISYLASEVALWLQIQCGEPWIYLGCHNLTGVTVPRGERAPIYCRVGKGKFQIQRTFRGEPGLGSLTIVANDTVLEYIQELNCEFNLFALHSSCGADENPFNFDYLYQYIGVAPTAESTDIHVAGITPGENQPVRLSMPAQFMSRLKTKKLKAQSRDVSAISVNDINGVSFCDDVQCGDLCGEASQGCQRGFMVTQAGVGNAVIIKTLDGGGSFASVASPFADATDDINSVACDGDLVIVTNGITSSYAYSWDKGLTFTEVLTPTKIINKVLILGGAKAWMVANDGYIYYSANMGASVSTQDAGVATSSTLLDISAASALQLYAVGEDNAFVRTEDGGATWVAVTGPAVGIFPNDLYRVAAVPGTDIVFVADEQGNLYRSTDMGDTWATVLTDYANLAGGIRGIAVPDCNTVAVVGNSTDPYFYANAVGYMYESFDGGNSWTAVELPTNTGVRDIFACSQNVFWVVGDDGFVAKVAGPSV